MNAQRGNAVISLLVIVSGVLGLTGWVMNIIDIFRSADGVTGELALRIAGIFIVPLGAILGYF
jgi:hypothetical protein